MVNLGTFISVIDKNFTVSTRLSIHEEDTKVQIAFDCVHKCGKHRK